MANKVNVRHTASSAVLALKDAHTELKLACRSRRVGGQGMAMLKVMVVIGVSFRKKVWG